MLNIEKTIKDNIKVKKKILDTLLPNINSACELMLKSSLNGKKIKWCGNGGSAADSQHMSAELVGGLRSHERKPIASISLTTDTSFITAWANDTGYTTIFSRQLEAIGNSGDVLVAISTSGNSKNIIKAVDYALKNKIKVIVLTGGTSGAMKSIGDVNICVPSHDTQRIQESHLLIEHILCESLEKSIIDHYKIE